MPFVKIDMWEGRDAESKRKLIKSVSKAISETLDIPMQHIHIVISEAPKDNWGIAGEQASQMQ